MEQHGKGSKYKKSKYGLFSMEMLSKIIELVKLPIKMIVWGSVFSGLLLILPDEILYMFRIRELVNEHKSTIGILFLGATLYVVINFVIFIYNKIKTGCIKKNAQLEKEKKKIDIENKTITKLRNLDLHEQAVLREFFIQGKNTIELPIDHHVIAGLLKYNVLEIISGMGTRNILFGLLASVSLSNAAGNYIYQNLDLIGLHNGEPTETEIQYVNSQRPKYIVELERFNSRYRR